MVWRSGSSYSGISNFFNDEYPMVRWLEANGYDVSYFSGVDTERRGTLVTNHKVFISAGHDEYWSSTQRANVESARAAGVNLAFFSGNSVFWKTRWENSIDGTNTPYRTLPLTYKETLANQPIDPADPPIWTGTWRDPRFSPPGDGGRPENALMGTIFTVNGVQFNDLKVPGDYGRLRFWRNTDLATLSVLQTATLGKSVLGYEWDEDLDNGARPRGLIQLSSTTANVAGHLMDNGSSYGPGPATHSLMLYRDASGALVFGAGTCQWSWGLDANDDNNAGAALGAPDPRIQQATVNLFADMGAQPGTLQSPLVAAVPSSDQVAPTTSINAIPGGKVDRGSTLLVSGTARDSGGGVVGGVEISINGGRWQKATGREDWSFAWVPTALGSTTIRAVAVDDSGNLATTGASISVNVVAGTPATRIWSATAVPATTTVNDPNPVEVGVKFASEVSGSITGIWFYKGANNNGVHFGHLWQGDGTLLATASYANETATGWQFAPFATPVPINANTTYVASYRTSSGFYSASASYFASASADSPPLHALRDGTDGPNGVDAYGGSGFPLFPSSTYQANNYWVDVEFSPSIAVPDHTTIWADTVVPPLVSADDPAGAELGVKFRVDVAGSITGIRFFKGAANTGTHVGKLWSREGLLLGAATFAGETISGWQQVNFPTPITVVPATTYIASYHAPVGRYAASLDYFASAGASSPPLSALQTGVDGSMESMHMAPAAFPRRRSVRRITGWTWSSRLRRLPRRLSLARGATTTHGSCQSSSTRSQHGAPPMTMARAGLYQTRDPRRAERGAAISPEGQ